MSRYIILFLGTHYVDGMYTNKEMAEGVMEYFADEKFPNLQFKLEEAPKGFVVTDDIFWSRHHDSIVKLDHLRSHSRRLR
jgi:hypothetical protein